MVTENKTETEQNILNLRAASLVKCITLWLRIWLDISLDISVPVIICGCNTGVANVSILVGKTSCTIADELTCKIKNTDNMI